MYNFSYGTQFIIDNNEYIVKNYNNSEIEVENLSYKKIEMIRTSDLLEKWINNELMFRINEKQVLQTTFNETINLIPDNLKNEAKRRYKILEPIIKGEILPSEVKGYLESLNVKKTQFYEWKKRWDTSSDIRALVPNKPGPKSGVRNKIIYDMLKTLVDEVCYNGEKFTGIQLLSELNLRIEEHNDEFRLPEDRIALISPATFRRYLKEIMDQNKIDQIKLGVVEAKLQQTGSTKEVYVSRPLQRVEIDWTSVDVMLINPDTGKAERPTLIYSIDKYSGYPLGFYVAFEDVNAAALKQCLLHTIIPKRYIRGLYPDVKNDWITYGIPEEIVLDNAKVNDSLDFEDACLQLGIDMLFVGVKAGNQKGTIERAFRELNTKFIHSLRGTTFSNIMEKGQYDSEGKACITLNGFIYMVHIALVDMVAQGYDRKRRGSPTDLWEQSLKQNPHLSFPLTQTIEELKVALMSGIKTRTITNKGVMVENEYFTSSELMDLRAKLIKKYGHSKNIRVRFDKADMRFIYIYDEFKKRYVEAQQTGLERRGYSLNRPIHYLEMELDSFLSRHPNPMDEMTNNAKALRKILKIQDKEEKEVKRLLKQKELLSSQHQNDVTNDAEGSQKKIAGIPNVEITTGETEEINIVESKDRIKGKMHKNKNKFNSAKNNFEDEEIPVYDAFIRNELGGE